MRRFFLVLFFVALASPLAGARLAFADENSGKRQIDLELEDVAGAISYEVELTSKVSGKTQSFKMKTPLWKATIRSGDYTLRLRSCDARGVPGEWSPPTPFTVKLAGPSLLAPSPNAEIKTKQQEKYDVGFKWQAVAGTEKYRVSVTPLDPTGGPMSVVTQDSKTDETTITLPVATRYTWQVTPISKTGAEGDSQETPGAFTLIGGEIPTIDVDKPEDIYVQTLKWSKPNHAEKFSYALTHQKKGKEWERIDAKKEFTLNEIPFLLKYPGGHYRFAIQAQANLREDSKPVKIDFNVFNGDRTPAAIEESKLRMSLEKPTQWYFVASYMVSDIHYNGNDSQSGQHINYSDIGGIGRLGLGYINPTTDRGWLGIVDLAGYTVEGKTVTWGSAEGHYIWRYNWGRNMIRPSVGVYYKELQETQNSATNTSTYTQDKIAVGGPHAGFDFWRPFTSKLGIQINARAYYDAVKISTPNNEEIVPQLSYQYGVMGSYKIQKNIMGFMGWAHRIDNASYKSTPGSPSTPSTSIASPGQTQDIQIDGDYFNMLLEWSF